MAISPKSATKREITPRPAAPQKRVVNTTIAKLRRRIATFPTKVMKVFNLAFFITFNHLDKIVNYQRPIIFLFA